MPILRVIDKGSVSQSVSLGSKQFTVGSHPGCDLTLAGAPGLHGTHLLLCPGDEQCWVSTAPGFPVADSQGRAIEAAYVAWGTRLSLGSLVFCLEQDELAASAKSEKKARNSEATPSDTHAESTRSSSSVHPIFLMVLACALALGALPFLGTSQGASMTLPADPPELFDAMNSCASENPRHRAVLAEDEAHARRERAVFDLQEGVAAAHLFREAELCYRAAGHEAHADAMLERGQVLRADLEEEARLIELRLSRALRAQRRDVARVQVRRLTRLFAHRPDSAHALALRRLLLRLSKEA